jgi:hypothetical protein
MTWSRVGLLTSLTKETGFINEDAVAVTFLFLFASLALA